MADRFYVPKFITIEDKLAGLLTFKQLFALLGAFLITYTVFKINQLAGLITGLISFGLAFLLTFVYMNGKPFMYVLPKVLDFFLRSRKYQWQQIKKITYKEVPELPEIAAKIPIPILKPREKVLPEKAEVILEYPNTSIKEKITLSLKEPIANQTDVFNEIEHHHKINPRNPYRFFPYIKFYKALK